ncbi:MAG TPA: prephenate dehydrogenase/arogenate dehydrogenase family protein [Bacteroidetes bacterium]|nr:prephenate dehydrogenase/arogenate dehydrogenase family protein [Bacteroidota bacterium]
MERILVAGAGNMGSWLAETLCLDYDVGVYDSDPRKLKYLFNTFRFKKLDEIVDFKPQLLINAEGLKQTIKAFDQILPYIPGDCIISDMASVKNGLAKFYADSGFKFVSTHPMFGPTFGNLKDMKGQCAIIISESDAGGKEFYKSFYTDLGLTLYEYDFIEHDRTIAYSLSIPFSSTIVFSACMQKLEVPGTAFKNHLSIARGLLSEDDCLLSGILLNKYSVDKLYEISRRLAELIELLENKEEEELHSLFNRLRKNIGLRAD